MEILSVFLEDTSLILTENLEPKFTDTSEMRAEKLKLAVHTKRWGLLSRQVWELYGNSRLHVATHTVEIIVYLIVKLLQ